MKSLIIAATALTMTGSAFAYQTYQTTTTTGPDGQMATTVSVDPNVTLAPPSSWTADQRALWDQHMTNLPASWTGEQRTAFQSMMAIPPASWTPEQRSLYEQHLASLPAGWTAEQRSTYEQQIASLRSPWAGDLQSAQTMTPADTTAARPDMSTFAGMGGPYEQAYGAGAVSTTPRAADRNYPPCSPGPGDDHCIQLYERGVRQQLASWDRPTGGLAGSETAMGGPYEPVSGEPATPAVTNPAATPSTTTGSTVPTSTGSTPSTSTDQTSTTNDPVGTAQDDTVEPRN